jgi:hypothetical protein
MTAIFLISLITMAIMLIIAGIGWGVSVSTVERLTKENSKLANSNKELSVEVAKQQSLNNIYRVALGEKKK